MNKHTKEIVNRLITQYGEDYMCHLHFNTPVQLLIATMLSAQCTDARVNMVTKDLFQKYPTVYDFATADLKELEKDIHSTGFYHNKAKNIIACCNQLIERHNGEVPSDIEALTALAGVGRKTANVVRGNIFDEPSVVVDTHVKRISKRLGVTKSEDPVKAEFELMKALDKEYWIMWNHHIINLGREICKALAPKCEMCFMADICPDYKARLKRKK